MEYAKQCFRPFNPGLSLTLVTSQTGHAQQRRAGKARIAPVSSALGAGQGADYRGGQSTRSPRDPQQGLLMEALGAGQGAGYRIHPSPHVLKVSDR